MIGPNRLNLSAKQMAKLVAKMKPITSNDTVIDKENVCLMWVGRYDDYGRPIFSVKGKYKLAKKLIYESWYGPIDGDKTVINTCFNLQCVRPNHLTQSFYFYQETKARDGKKDPKNKRKRWIIKVTEKLMLKVFNGIKCGRLK